MAHSRFDRPNRRLKTAKSAYSTDQIQYMHSRAFFNKKEACLGKRA